MLAALASMDTGEPLFLVRCGGNRFFERAQSTYII